MNELDIDRAVGGTPCLCGFVGSWHPRCYAGKSQAEIDTAYKQVYARLRVQLREKRKLDAHDAAAKLIKRASS